MQDLIPVSDAWIIPDWPAPPCVRALTTTRIGGISVSPFDTLNMARHVGDRAGSVAANRQWLHDSVGLSAQPRWLRQAHGNQIVDAGVVSAPVEADGSYTRAADTVCVVLTADCLPLLLCERFGAAVAVAHAGWRGMAAGVVEAAVASLAPVAPDQLMAWLGPAIGPIAFVVKDEVRATFLAKDVAAAEAFHPVAGDRWQADLYQLARQRLVACGVGGIHGGGFCTYTDEKRFYSFRRNKTTGRMATLIWIQS
ncbi:MAG: peptidoglycan editing factor PgeF [Gammaproteobacteria bacterium]